MHRIILVFFAAFIFPSMAYAQVPAESHAIIQKIAQTEYREVTLQAIGLKVPSDWPTRNREAGGIAFTDPRYDAIVGAVYPVANLTDLAAEVGSRFVTTFDVISNANEGSSIVLAGRVGGEETRVLAASLSINGAAYVFFASAPEAWFKTYLPVFEDVLKSIH